MDLSDTVYPADDKDFEDFKNMCESDQGWLVGYNKKNLKVCTKFQAKSNIKLLKVSLIF